MTLAGGERHHFEAVPAEPGAGLLRVTGPEAEADVVVAGWIVSNDGEHRGSLRVGGVARTAPPPPDGSVIVDGARYPVSIFLTSPENPATPPGVPIPYPNTGTVATRERPRHHPQFGQPDPSTPGRLAFTRILASSTHVGQ